MKKLIFFVLTFSVISIISISQVISDFEIDNDTEDWHSEGDGDYDWEGLTGNPGGCFRVNDDATGDMNRAYAPVKFLGDWSTAIITDYVSADIYLHDAGSGYVNPNFVFRIAGPGGSAKALWDPIPTPPHDTWITYSVNLDETEWYIESGTWTDILAHVSSFIVTMEYISGDEWNLMDNVILSISPVTVPIAPGLCSDFESGLFEGWSTIDATKTIVNTGGNPGKYFRINDGTGTSLVVPSSVYHGDWSALDEHNAEIHMDLQITNINGPLYLHDFFVKISGPGGVATYPINNSIENAFNKWHSFGIPIDQPEWTVSSGDWNTLMNFVDDIQVIAEFISGGEDVGLDNFCISDSPPVSDFLAKPTYVFLSNPVQVQFTDLTTSAPQQWNWDFGDLNTSSDINPQYLYSTPGVYDVSLSTSNYYGNSTETKTAYIEVYPEDQCLKFEDDFEDDFIYPTWSFKNGTWSESNGNMRQTSNHYTTDNYLDGCFAVTGIPSWENYIVSCDFESTDNDIIGFVFNYQDEQNMYMFRWRLDPLYRGLYKYENGIEIELALDDVGYVKNNWYHADIYSLSGTIVLVIDGVEIFAVNDNTFTTGLAGPYCWGNQSSYFDNFKVECAGTPVELNVFAEGPIVGTVMNTDLNTENLLPIANPFTISPWNYTGSEGVLHYSNPDVVDWVLVDFRDATSAANALPGTSVAKKAALLLNDGQIISPYGGLPLFYNVEITNSLYAVVWHRNHLGILSADPLMDFGGALLYDFTSSASQAYGTNAQKDLGSGIYGMYAGDLNADGNIDDLDKELAWEVEAGKSGYVPSDCNLDGQADNLDKNEMWLDNKNKSSQVPD